MNADKISDNVSAFTTKPTASIVFITPETAARWLGVNTHNRNIREADVRNYARDMANGGWQMTGEAIKFAADGTLLDGQHRLLAIIRSECTVAMYVMRGIPTASQRVMDTGRKRTASDALSIGKEASPSQLASMIKLALGVESGIADPGHYQATHSEIEDYLCAHPDLREAVSLSHVCARRTDCPPSVVAYTYWRMARLSPGDAAEFWTAAAEKVGLRPKDPVLALTNRLAEARRNRESLSKRILLSLVFRAWNARREGKTMTFIRVNSPTGGLVPVPELR